MQKWPRKRMKFLLVISYYNNFNIKFLLKIFDNFIGLQYENTEPLAYFMELVQFYEKELVKFREKIELTNKHLHSLVQPKRVGEQGN